jgi:hypothetical protein
MGGDGEERVGEHGQGDVPVPGAVAADLVVVQAGLVLRFREAFLQGARHHGELREDNRARRVAAVEGQLEVAFLAGLQGPAGQQPAVVAVGTDQRPVVKTRAFRPVGDRNRNRPAEFSIITVGSEAPQRS